MLANEKHGLQSAQNINSQQINQKNNLRPTQVQGIKMKRRKGEVTVYDIANRRDILQKPLKSRDMIWTWRKSLIESTTERAEMKAILRIHQRIIYNPRTTVKNYSDTREWESPESP